LRCSKASGCVEREVFGGETLARKKDVERQGIRKEKGEKRRVQRKDAEFRRGRDDELVAKTTPGIVGPFESLGKASKSSKRTKRSTVRWGVCRA